ncbi:Teichoic acids export ATP-binding protein TagH [Aquicella siphonis]|uniref:Teichoic acids export ATP-binding protein TagH n=1 Tax=Aquicella siphonis TaxID=254247 RepID=A0A5E4PHI4_9COXI|nr:ABC transporter ATP-binding protein [Aquicella siphonis]VVC76469.1 Teichoic acids export ATP-binding protein TagH [Aquicella siphonis]
MAQIDLRSVFVEFPIFNLSSRSLKKQFLKLATGGSIVKDANEHVLVKALNDITLSFHHGERIGLIGHNGSGKSTLLRLLAKIYEPSRGDLRIDGHVSPMLDFVMGVEAEFTGYENIYTRGVLLGLTRKEIKRQVHEIAELTGLGDYLSMPVRTYSSGMKIRLAFAISTSIKPEILLIDEVFGAGDSDFMDRARQKMISLLDQSSIVVMATHSDALIREFCNKALLLENGQIKFFGPVDQALAIYHMKKPTQ